MQAIVLAAGEGTRMRPLTYTKPKVMLPVLNKPILEHLIIEIKKSGMLLREDSSGQQKDYEK